MRYNKSRGMRFTWGKNVACVVVLSRFIVLIYSFPWSKQKTALIARTAGATRFNSSLYWRHKSSSDVMIASSSTQQICRIIHPLKAWETVCILNLRHWFYFLPCQSISVWIAQYVHRFPNFDLFLSSASIIGIVFAHFHHDLRQEIFTRVCWLCNV